MLKTISLLLACLPALASATQTGPELGKPEGRCRAEERGPAIIVNVQGLKDRSGLLKLEVYPANDPDFLADDSKLIDEGKTFRRVEVPTPKTGAVQLCVRVPGPGPYSISLLHDRDSNHKFSFSTDGIGFASNPKLHRRQPKAAEARIVAGVGLTVTTVIMNYWNGFLSMRPL